VILLFLFLLLFLRDTTAFKVAWFEVPIFGRF